MKTFRRVQGSTFGSNKFFLLKMFAIARDNRAHSDQSSCPKLECLRTANASSLSHQVANSSVHRFYTAGGRREI